MTGPDGTKWPVTQAHAVDKTITATVDAAAAKAGAHTLAWKAQADDGDVIAGSFTFTMNVAAQPTSQTSSAAPTSSVTMSAPVTNAPPTTTQSESGGVPAWVWVVVVLLVVVGAILLVRRRKA